MQFSFSPESVRKLEGSLKQEFSKFSSTYPGESIHRQPIHTVYGGAHLFRADTSRKMGEAALHALAEYAPDASYFSQMLDPPPSPDLAKKVYSRVQEKLRREPVEDFRIDFEDGYGNRPNAEEDSHAIAVADQVAEGHRSKTLPPFIGIRIKPLTEELFSRSVRTLDLFVTRLAEQCQGIGTLPEAIFVTLPKVTLSSQVATLAHLLGMLETKLGLPSKKLKIELMVETPQSIFNAAGEAALPHLVQAAQGRCTGAHFGTYDYTASCNIVAAHQTMAHPACDFARHVMQVALSGTGIFLSDGATNILPVGPHRPKADRPLSESEFHENQETVRRAWKLSSHHIRHSLVNAFYQGWDLHPAQLPVRYATVYTFFLEGLEAASLRLKAFMEQSAKATLSGDIFDDAATGQGLLNFFLRGMSCGAITEDETTATGLTLDEIRCRSFYKILEGRKKR